MVARTLLTASAALLSVGLLAQHATGSEAPVVHKTPVIAEFKVDVEAIRKDLDAHVRELNERLRQDLHRELSKTVLASNELRSRL
ncbi:MAG TPA: hypothetical protein VIQ99_09635 [Gammaproteobacteria bacterium]